MIKFTTPSLVLVWLMWLAGLGAAAQYGKVAVIFDQLPTLYPDGGARLGFALSLVGFVGILFGVAAGLVVARLRYRRALIWGLLAGAVMSAYQATVPSLPLFMLSRVIEGMSHLAIVVATPTLISLLSTPAQRGFTLTLWGTFFGVAFTVLVWGGLPFVARFGVPALFWAHAAYMAGFALILALTLPRVQAPQADGDLSFRGIVRRHVEIYRSASISAPAIGWVPYTLSYVSLLTLLPPYIAPDIRTFIVGAMPLVSIASSLTLGVFLLRHVSAILVMQIGFGGAAAAAVALAFVQGDPILCLLLAASLGLVQGAGFAAVPELNAELADRAQANGALAQAGNMGNTFGPPILLAAIAIGGYPSMMVVAALVLLCGVFGQMILARRRSLPN